MFGFKKHFKNLLIRHNIISSEFLEIISKDPFNKRFNNQITKHQFFYSALYLIKANGISGDYAEFGCFSGTTFKLAYLEKKRQNLDLKFWAFDSFKGLPDGSDIKDLHPAWKKGAMSMSVNEFIKKNDKNNFPRSGYNIIPGFYEKSLNDKTTDFPSDISLAYIDCDFYSSTMDVLRFLVPRLKHGMIIAFDDYFMYSSNSISRNRNAMLEIFDEKFSFQLLPYMQYSHTGFSFIVEDKNINTGS